MDPIIFSTIFLPGLLGGLGGITRGVVGLLKALALRRKILWGYYTITVIVALVIGVFIGLIFNFDPRSLSNFISSVILLIIFPTIHFSWGIGFLIGFFYWNCKKIYQNICLATVTLNLV